MANNVDKINKNKASLAKAKKYQGIHLKLRIVKTILWVVFLLVILFFGISSGLRNWAESINPNPWLVVLFYLMGLSILAEFLFLPLSYYSGFSVEKRFGLSTESRSSWLKDYMKSLSINLFLSIILVEFLYYLLRAYTKWWWLIAAFGFILFFILLARLAPIILFPLFFKFKPIEDEELKNRLLQLSEKLRVRILDILEMDLSKKSKTANAALAGLGKSRRIILSDTLLSNFDKDEIETILAHELGHYVGGHLWKGIILQGFFSVIGFYLLNLLLMKFITYFGFRNISDIASFPIAILVILFLGFILMPLSNMYARNHERKADYFALKQTIKPSAFISAMKKLAELNLADPQPHPLIEFIFYSHPSIKKRIKMAQDFLKNNDCVL